MQTIALEFERGTGVLAALGTDTLMGLDGRWNAFSRECAIYDRVYELRSKFPGKYGRLHFVGFNYMGRLDYTPNHLDVRMSDPNPPAWVTS